MPSGLPTLIPDTHAGGLGCRARRLRLHSQTISTFYSVLYPDTYGYASGVGCTPLQCVPQPPLAIPTRQDSHLISVLHSEQVAIRHQPPTHRGLMNARYFACGTSFTAHSGREDYSLWARRVYCQATPRSGGLYSQPRTACDSRHGGVGYCRSASPTTKSCLSINYATPLCAVCSGSPSNPFSAPSASPFAMPTQRHTHIDNTPTPDPDVRTAEALSPFRLSVNRYTRSAFCRSRFTLPTPHTHFSRYSVPCARLKSVLLRRGCQKLL